MPRLPRISIPITDEERLDFLTTLVELQKRGDVSLHMSLPRWLAMLAKEQLRQVKAEMSLPG